MTLILRVAAQEPAQVELLTPVVFVNAQLRLDPVHNYRLFTVNEPTFDFRSLPFLLVESAPHQAFCSARSYYLSAARAPCDDLLSLDPF